MSQARILLTGGNPKDIDGVVSQIIEIAKALDMKVKGPVALPRKKLTIVTRRTPCGDGSDTYETWQKRLSKRFIDVEGSEKVIKQILRVKVPEGVFVKILLK